MSPSGRPTPILFIHHRSELGGSPQSLYYLLLSLDRSRFEPHVFCPQGPAAELFRKVGAEVHTGAVAGFTHIWASTYRGLRWLLLGKELWHLPRHIADLRRVLSLQPFGIVHLNDSPLIPAAVIARRAGIPVVWHLRSALPDDEGLRSRLMRAAVKRYSVERIAINEDVARSFRVAATVIPNSIDLEAFRPGDAALAREKLGLANDRPIISFFGYIYPSKGVQDFIRSAALIRDRGIDARFLVVGGSVRGEEFFRSSLGRALEAAGVARDHARAAAELVAELGLDELVTFVPYTSETALYYQASDLVVAPSRGPELGRPVVEAAACGRAVIASGSLGGGGLLLPGKTGYLVPQRSPHMIAIAAARLLGDPELRDELGRNARLHAENSFGTGRKAELVMDVYERVLAAG